MEHSLTVNETSKGKEGVLSLVGDLTMLEAQETKRNLLEAIEEVDILHLDLQNIEKVDVSFIQLICASHRECFLSEKTIDLQDGVNDTMEKLLEDAGYTKQCGCYPDAKDSCLWKQCASNCL